MGEKQRAVKDAGKDNNSPDPTYGSGPEDAANLKRPGDSKGGME